MNESEKDILYMQKALELAQEAAQMDEVPIGAVLVYDGEIIACAKNERESAKCAIRHAEISVIEEGCRRAGGWRLPGAVLYVTLEPCTMCAGAIANARIARVVFGAYDKKAGAYGSVFNLLSLPLNHIPAVRGGVLAEEASQILSEYFKNKRTK